MSLKFTLLEIADAYMSAAGIEADSTVSHRVFGDTKKLTALRGTAGITTGRFESALVWFDQNWPANTKRPKAMADLLDLLRRDAVKESRVAA